MNAPSPKAKAHYLIVAAFYLLIVVVQLYRAITIGNWQGFPIAAVSLAAFLTISTIIARQQRGNEHPAHPWILIGSIWLIANTIGILVAGLGILLAIVSLLSSVILANLVFDQARANRAVILAFIAVIPLILVEFILQLDFRLTLPADVETAIPGIIIVILIVLVLFMLRQFPSYSLRQKLVISYLFLALLPMGTLGYLNSVSFRETLTNTANQALFSVAQQTAREIDNFINTNQQTILIESRFSTFEAFLSTPADDPNYQTARVLAQALLFSLHEIHTQEAGTNYLLEYMLMDSEGIVLFNTGVNPIFPAGADLLVNDIFNQPSLTSEPYASPVQIYDDPSTASIYFSASITDQQARPIGVLAARYSSLFLQDIIASQNGQAGAGSFGVLFDESRIQVANGSDPEKRFKLTGAVSPERYQALIGFNRLPDLPQTSAELNQPELETRLNNYFQNPFFSSLETIGGENVTTQVAVTPLSSYRWLVAFFQPEEIFLAPLTTQTNRSLVIVAGVIIGATFIAIFASTQLSRPLIQLTAAAEQVTAGNLNVTAPVETSDEIGVLATTFNSMTSQLRGTLGGLERLVAERTARLQATNEVGRVATTILDPRELITRIVNLITDRFGYYYAAIFLVDQTGKWAELADATGQAGATLKERHHRLEVGGQSMVGTAIAERKARIALDIGDEPIRFDNPLLPGTRSEIALPLLSGANVLGALDVQSTDEAAFGEQDIDTLQNMANQVAIAIENALLFERTQRVASTQQAINEITARIQQSANIEHILETTILELSRVLAPDEITIQLTGAAEPEKANGRS
jgi:HAMP domain-containing protein